MLEICISGYVDFQKSIQFLHFLTRLCYFCLYEKNIFCQTSTKTVSGCCWILKLNQNSIWLMFDIKCQPELYLVDV